MKFIFTLLFPLFFIIPQQINSQSDLRFNHLTADDGLTSSYINCLLKDDQGFLWIGTNSGLNRFDGKFNKTYTHTIGDSTTIINNNITALFEDSLHRIWIGTDGGLSIILPGSPIIHNYKTIISDRDTIDLSVGIRIIGYYDNRIWIATQNRLLSTDIHNFSLELSQFNSGGKNQKGVFFIPSRLVTTDEGMWILSSKGPVYSKDGKTFFTAYNNPKKWSIFNNGWIAAMASSGDSLLYYTSFNFPGLYILNTQNQHLDSIEFKDDQYTDIEIISLSHAGDTILWGASSHHGIFKINTSVKTYEFCKPQNTNPTSLGISLIFELLCDDQGLTFVGTDRGLFYTSPLQPKFNIHSIENTELANLSVAIEEDKNGMLWLATLHKGLYSYNPVNNHIDHYTFPDDYNKIWTLVIENNEILMVTEGGLATFSINTKIFQKLKLPETIHNITANPALFIIKDKLGSYWIGYVYSGVLKYNFETGEYTYFKHRDRVHNLPGYSISTATLDPNGTIWLGYFSNDISAIDPVDNSIRNIKVMTHPKSESIGYISSLNADNNGNLWIATSQGGLIKHEITTGQFKSFDTRNGLSSNLIGSVIIDRKENLWLTTSNALTKLDPNTELITNYTSSDGLAFNQFNASPTIISKAGTILIWSDHLITSFNPDDIASNPSYPNIILNSYEKSGVPYSNGFSTNNLNFTHRDKLITFKFSAINFIDPDKTEYAYKLDGLDDTWYYTGNQASASFTALPQGNYTLHVKATNKSNDWNVPEKTISFHVDGPLWAKGWFIILCFSLALMLMYGLYRYRLAQLEKLQAIRNRISKDLHDDLGSTLSSISINSALAQKIAPPSENGLNPVLQDIGESARSAMDNMSDIVWAINPANETVDNMIERLQKFAQKLLAAQNIKLTLDMNPMLRNTKLTLPQRKNMYLILKESINNMAKYSKASNCYILGRLENKKIHITIEDDGDGFQTDIVTSGNGIVNMKSRATELNGTLTVNSADLKGTVINLEFAT